MRKRIYIGSLLTLASVLAVVDCRAQKIVINSRQDLSLTIGYCQPLGKDIVDQQPALLANMQQGLATELRFLTSISEKFRVGVSGSYTAFDGWHVESAPLFERSSASFASVGVTMAFKNWSPDMSFHNKFNVFGAITPAVSYVSVRTSSESEINSGSETVPLEVTAVRMGLHADAGVYVNVSQMLSLVVSGSYRIVPVESKVFSEKSFSYLSFNVGVSLRLAKDRRYMLHAN